MFVRILFLTQTSLFPFEGAVSARRPEVDKMNRPRRGDGRARTGDPLLAKQVLSQLSYIPAATGGPSWDRTRDLALIKRAL